MSEKKPAQKPIGLSENELRAKYDNVYKIREAVKKLQRGRFLTDQQMREMCKISPNVWRGYAEKTEFEKYKYKPTAKEVWWSTPDSVRRVREGVNV